MNIKVYRKLVKKQELIFKKLVYVLMINISTEIRMKSIFGRKDNCGRWNK
jgi:hypothetical protein